MNEYKRKMLLFRNSLLELVGVETVEELLEVREAIQSLSALTGGNNPGLLKVLNAADVLLAEGFDDICCSK
jgi:hypothetical protein